MIVAVGMATLLYGFMFSNDFLIASVEVRGTTLGDPAEVALAANAIGQSIFRIDAGHVAQRVAALPYVERVTVQTRFPDRVVLSVTERTPALVWQAGGQRLLVDRRGHVIAVTQSVDFPAVMSAGDAPKVGDRLEPATVAAALAIHETLDAQLAELWLEPVEGLVARLTNGRSVMLGDPTDMPLKLAIFEEVTGDGGDWSLLDLREPGRPYYK